MTVDTQPFLRGTRIYPQPIAVACDRVYRSRTPSEQVDAILKCAEIVARYVAALALSSFSARSDTSVAPSPIIQSFKGKLTFGSFTKVAEEVYGLAGVHPLGVLFDTAWRGQQPASEWAETALNQLRQIRNDIGHDLANLSEVDARAMLEQKMPHELLTLVLKRFDALLSLPVFIIEAHELEHTNLYAQQVVLMGASADPLPERVELPIGTGAIPRRIPFVGYPDGILCLEPFLIWDIAPNKGNFALYFVHEIEAGQVVYQSVGKDERSKGGQLREEIARRILRALAISARDRRAIELRARILG